MRGKVRLTVDVAPQLNQILEDIARDTGTSKSEVFKKAVALIDVSHRARKQGKRVGIARDDQTLETEFIGL